MYEIQSTTWFRDDVLSGLINSMLGPVTGIATMILTSFLVLKVGYEYFKASTAGLNDSSFLGKLIDFDEIIRCLGLMILLGLYPALSKSITESIRYVNSQTDKSSSTYQEIQQVANDYYYKQNIAPLVEARNQAYMDYQFHKGSSASGSSDKAAAAKKVYEEEARKIGEHGLNMNGTIAGMNEDPTSKASVSIWSMLWSPFEMGISSIINGVLWIIAMAIKWGVSAYARVIYKILIVLGPLAIATSIFWKDKFMTWFEALLNTGLTFTVLNILDWVVSEYWYQMFITDATNADNSMGIGQSIAFNLSLIGCYLSSFKLTAMWIGKPVAGAIMGKGMTVAGIIAAAGIMALTGGKGAKLAEATSSASSKAAAD